MPVVFAGCQDSPTNHAMDKTMKVQKERDILVRSLFALENGAKCKSSAISATLYSPPNFGELNF
jgi:hypothetical protein